MQGKDRCYFFDEGLQFTCVQCGTCCTGAPGTIYVASDEIQTIAAVLNITEQAFVSDYLYPYQNSYSIREDSQGRCLFYDQGCTIYHHRPLQCRTFPFWFDNIRSENRWQRIARQCPGIGQGRRYSKDEIIALALQTTHL